MGAILILTRSTTIATMNSRNRPHPTPDWFMIEMSELEAEISDRRKHIAQLKAELTAENRLLRTMEMDLANKQYELKLANRVINKYDN